MIPETSETLGTATNSLVETSEIVKNSQSFWFQKVTVNVSGRGNIPT